MRVGSICAIMSYTACAAPYARVMIYGIIPMPLWGVVAGFFLYDLYGASRHNVCPPANRGAHITYSWKLQPGSNVSFSGHIGGTVGGIAIYFLSRGRIRLS